jgi:type II secretory pathway pseudopilin PulG
MKNIISQFKARSGFTIAELVVAMGVFVVLVGIVSSIFIKGLRTQRAIVNLISANDNASLALEQMAREFRTGLNFCIPDAASNCTLNSSGSAIRFTNANGATVVYRLSPGAAFLERSADGGATFTEMTGDIVAVRRLLFALVHNSLGQPGAWPPRILVSMQIGTQSLSSKEFLSDIQTVISGRNI